ncbi:MAG: sulfatase-like hydrolase/transferase, partial [Verrucomicrobiota bacterium]
MNSRLVLLCALVSASLLSLASLTHAKDGDRPNVIFIIVDDLNDLPYQPDGKPLVPTPNIDRLKSMGVTFTNAHTNNPLCAPARASMMFGLYPQTTGLYWFEQWQDNGIYQESVPLETNLRNGGYQVLSTGKVYHGGNVGNFDEFGPIHDFGPWPWDGREETKFGFIPHPQQLFLYEGEDADVDFKWEHVFGPLSQVPDWPADPEEGVPGYKGWTLRGKPYRYFNAQDRDPIADELITTWVTEVIERRHTQPFALFTGLVRTHTPLYAPDDYFERFPLDSIELPEVIPNDLDDTASALGNEELYGFRRYNMLVRHEDRDLLRKWLQAYMACVSFID